MVSEFAGLAVEGAIGFAGPVGDACVLCFGMLEFPKRVKRGYCTAIGV